MNGQDENEVFVFELEEILPYVYCIALILWLGILSYEIFHPGVSNSTGIKFPLASFAMALPLLAATCLMNYFYFKNQVVKTIFKENEIIVFPFLERNPQRYKLEDLGAIRIKFLMTFWLKGDYRFKFNFKAAKNSPECVNFLKTKDFPIV